MELPVPWDEGSDDQAQEPGQDRHQEERSRCRYDTHQT